MTALARRARRRARGGAWVDLNLVSLIDVFTILIFFLLAHALEPQTLQTPAGMVLPEARSDVAPPDALELALDGATLRLQGRPVATLGDGPGARLDEAGRQALQRALHSALQTTAPLPTGTPAPQPLVLLADRERAWQELREVMQVAAAAGVTDIAFAVRREEAS